LKIKSIILVVHAISLPLTLTLVYVWPFRHVVFYAKAHLVPFYREDKGAYCGEASIQMLMSFYGVSPPVQDALAEEAGFYGNVTPWTGMTGPFAERGFQVSLTTIENYSDVSMAHLQLAETVAEHPVIVSIELRNETSHYIVVFQCDQNGIAYNDPMIGPSCYLSSETFCNLWFSGNPSSPMGPSCLMLTVG
jgi:hypothetical protein